MKAFKLCLLLAFIGLATTASAQFVNSNSGNNNSTSMGGGSSFDFTAVKTSGWNRFYVSYNPSKMTFDYDDADDVDFKGFTAGYLRGFSLTRKIPLYMEIGMAFQYRTYKDEEDGTVSYEGYTFDGGYTDKYTMMSLNIPVNLLYRFNINDDFSISPYFGLDFRINISADRKLEVYIEDENESEEYDLFEKDEAQTAGFDDAWGRFQAGWHIGVGLDYKALHIGVEYGKDFNEIAKKAKISTTSITLGVNF